MAAIPSPDNRYHYLLALNIRYADGTMAIGNNGLALTTPIRTLADIRQAETALSTGYLGANVVITNIVLLSGPTDHQQPTNQHQPTPLRSPPTTSSREADTTREADETDGW